MELAGFTAGMRLENRVEAPGSEMKCSRVCLSYFGCRLEQGERVRPPTGFIDFFSRCFHLGS